MSISGLTGISPRIHTYAEIFPELEDVQNLELESQIEWLPAAARTDFSIKSRLASLSPTKRFIKAHSIWRINYVLEQYGATKKDIALFKKMIAQEGEGFLGYQGGSSTVQIFQDILFLLVKQILQIPIKDDFVFLRVPGDPAFCYDQALDFLKEQAMNIPPEGWDTDPEIRKHILSLNLNLYQSYDAPWDLTPRYFLENTTWTSVNVKKIIQPFLASLGVDEAALDDLWDKALDLLPHDRGYILQFFDQSDSFSFAKEHSYIAYSGGEPHPAYTHHEILFDKSAINFPQMRLVLGNGSTLNPCSSLSIKRYDGMTGKERKDYESALGSLLQDLSFDPNKVEAVREQLISLWSSDQA